MCVKDKDVADSLRRAQARRDELKKYTLSLYACKAVAKDCKVFGVPFVAVSDESALQAVSQVVPSGLNLFRVGSFRSDTGKVVSLPRPVLVKGKVL